MRIFTAHGGENGVLGVGAIFNGHFAQQHRADTTVVGVDQLWIDVGASSRADAEKLGIALLDPVIADRPAWTYEGYAAGPAAAARAPAARPSRPPRRARVTSGETVFILAAQHVMNWSGLNGALARLGHYDDLTLIGETRGGRGAPPTKSIVPRTRFTGSLVESIGAPMHATCSPGPRPPPASRSRRASSGSRPPRRSPPRARRARTPTRPPSGRSRRCSIFPACIRTNGACPTP